ncbi:hypothetical protein PMAYCL1PPCAC_16982, partial [Pristionchus mayeri]
LVLTVLLSCLVQLAASCAATSPATTPAPTLCQSCAQNLITITMAGGGAHEFQSDMTSTTGACNVRTFVCTGPNANIEINNGDGVIADGDDGAVDATANLQVTCNAAGTAWEAAGVAITQVECSS